MNNCINCNKETSNEKFCSRSCAATHNNAGVRRHGNAPKPCKHCGEPTSNAKFCSHECSAKTRREECYKKIKEGVYDLTWSGNRVLRDFLIMDRGYQCEGCKLSVWKDQPIPLSVHHEDGNASNNDPDNISLLCLNCHGITPNYGRKNKNSARKYRQAFVV